MSTQPPLNFDAVAATLEVRADEGGRDTDDVVSSGVPQGPAAPLDNSPEAKGRRRSSGEIAGANSRAIRGRKPAVVAAHSGQDARPNGGHLVVYDVREALRLQGLPEEYLDDCPLTKTGKMKAIANGVPLPMGRAIARAVRESVEKARVLRGHNPQA